MTRSPLGLLRQVPPPVADSLLALAVAALACASLAPPDVLGATPPDALGYTLAGLSGLPLALRRRFPLAVLAVCTLALAAFYALGYKGSFVAFGTLIAMYTLAVRSTPRRAILVGAAVLAAVLACAVYGVSGTGWPNFLAGAAYLVTAIAIAQAVRGHTERLAERAELAEQRAREHRLEAERAVADERMRIAGELHDVVAHHLSVIAVQTGLACYVLDSDPPAARTALHTVSATTTESLDELRRMLRVLRPPTNTVDSVDAENPEDAEEFRPQPGLAELSALTDRVRTAGVAVRLVVSGAQDGVPAGQALCAYRVAQEALTNVLNHTDGAEVLMHVDRSDAELTLRVVDTGPASSGGAGAGYGHVGMRERARTYGGSVEIGPRPGGGYGVLLRLPLPARDAALERQP